jgi:hypothetical protein
MEQLQLLHPLSVERSHRQVVDTAVGRPRALFDQLLDSIDRDVEPLLLCVVVGMAVRAHVSSPRAGRQAARDTGGFGEGLTRRAC